MPRFSWSLWNFACEGEEREAAYESAVLLGDVGSARRPAGSSSAGGAEAVRLAPRFERRFLAVNDPAPIADCSHDPLIHGISRASTSSRSFRT